MTAWTLFYNPMTLSSAGVLWLSLPLVFLLSLSYKAIRVKNIERIWLETIKTFVLLMLGLAGFAIAIYVVQLLALKFL